MPPTDSARSALTSFTCTLCNKSYSRHPEYEAHISSYDHQHKKRLRDLKQLSRDPNAAERARKAERKADAEAGLVVVDTAQTAAGGKSSAGGGGFKKGGFKSSFTVVSAGSGGATGAGNAAAAGGGLIRKNVLGDDDEDEEKRAESESAARPQAGAGSKQPSNDVESDTDEEYGKDDVTAGGGYYNPRLPTGCYANCKGASSIPLG
ncbi:conserved hypothetical protein [Uncinocarpus reesii 1704]|uniref:C2H2-type domain-containing protein n=1 Tax=Uncinocarpus reesii (strain UAMH 1704) TaxID=336963 RepID=C4JGN7_UNCRE|nr:uncharacterized protein UREG_02549 [Uncinocarpus reesii 1704]EEP77700.1 conserved hypothetical protein [Uncinocarpus reesii 1704]